MSKTIERYALRNDLSLHSHSQKKKLTEAMSMVKFSSKVFRVFLIKVIAKLTPDKYIMTDWIVSLFILLVTVLFLNPKVFRLHEVQQYTDVLV